MRKFILLAMLVLAGCTYSSSSHARLLASPMECVPYARQVSGIEIYGDAYTWWNHAYPHYGRGKTPEAGAVLVLSKTDRLQHGHVAVVQRVIAPRMIEVTHVNWGRDWYTRRKVYESMQVMDVSRANDWSQLRFWSPEEGGFGRVYLASGFVYRRPQAVSVGMATPAVLKTFHD